jgi:3-isopropylmalate/(R)-2-methylmalate dehydratase small subunit
MIAMRVMRYPRPLDCVCECEAIIDLPIVRAATRTEIMVALVHAPELPVTVDLEQQSILCANRSYTFTIDPVRRTRLLKGWDDIALTESYRHRISAFKASDRNRQPWAMPVAGSK